MILGLGTGIPMPSGVGATMDGPFSPLDLSPVLWLDASDTSTITEVAGSVSQWDDKSGNGYHVTQGTAAKQPTSGTRTLNGANVLDFDGTSDGMATGTFAAALSDRTVFVVGQVDSTAAGNKYFVDGDDAATRRNAMGTNGSLWIIHCGIPITASGADTDPHVLRLQAASTDTLHVDGVEVISGNAGSDTIQGLSIGAYPTLTTAYLDGVIGEIIVIDGTLSADQIAATESYLADKWGITL